MADVRLVLEVMNEKTKEVQLISLFVEGTVEIVPLQEGGATSLEGYQVGTLHEVKFLANSQVWTWGLVNSPTYGEYQSDEQEESGDDTPD